GIQARSFRHRPAFQDAAELQPEVVVQPRGVMALDIETESFFKRFTFCTALPARLGRAPEVAHFSVTLQGAARHGSGAAIRGPARVPETKVGSWRQARALQVWLPERISMGPAIALRLRQHLTLTPQVQ